MEQGERRVGRGLRGVRATLVERIKNQSEEDRNGIIGWVARHIAREFNGHGRRRLYQTVSFEVSEDVAMVLDRARNWHKGDMEKRAAYWSEVAIQMLDSKSPQEVREEIERDAHEFKMRVGGMR